MEKELAVARDIQLGLLPRAAPELPGWTFGVAYEPARRVGGDFYDIFELPGRPGEYGLVVADVADKGVPAALLMAVSRTLIRAAAAARRRPAAILELVNDLLGEESQSSLFVTVLFGVLNPRTGRLCFSNGGHTRPLWIHASGEIEELSIGGIALGVLENIELAEYQILLEPGDLIVAFTDGVTEAINPAGESYGSDRLLAALGGALQAGRTAPEQIVSVVLNAVTAFAEGAEQADDLTILALRRSPSAASSAGPGI
jgi:sigma-B regulation protein RsbU (phosphoserine phosphatase)